MSRRCEWLSTCWLLSYLSPYADDPALPGTPEDWKPILTTADRGLVLSGLAASLFRKKAEIPVEVREHLELSLELHSLRNRIVQNEVFQLIGALNDRDIEPVVIKGATTLLSGGATLAERLMLDVDIWIPDPVQRAAALQCLESLGYRSTGPAEAIEGAHHYPPHFKPGSLSRVELHYDLFPESHRDLLDEESGIGVISTSFGDLKFGVLDENTALRLSYSQCRLMYEQRHILLTKWIDFLERCLRNQLSPFEGLHALGFSTEGHEIDRQLLTAFRELCGLPYTGPTDRRLVTRWQRAYSDSTLLRAARNYFRVKLDAEHILSKGPAGLARAILRRAAGVKTAFDGARKRDTL